MATMTGALSGDLGPRDFGRPAARADARGRAAIVRVRSLGHPHERLGLDGFGGPAVLVVEPVDAEVEIDPGRGDGAVSGLGLDGFDGHARLAQPGEAGVAQFVAGAVGQFRPALVQPG